MEKLKQFYQDKLMREAFVAFFKERLESRALSDMRQGKDLKHYPLSEDVLNTCMNDLKEMFEPKKEPKRVKKNM